MVAKTCAGRPQLNEIYHFYFSDEYDWYATVSQVDKNKCIYFTMNTSNLDWPGTTFGFDLDTTNAGTKVDFFHKDWQIENDHFKVTSYCWAMLLQGLKNLIEKNIVVPFEERS
jgi:hypothetical protein